MNQGQIREKQKQALESTTNVILLINCTQQHIKVSVYISFRMTSCVINGVYIKF